MPKPRSLTCLSILSSGASGGCLHGGASFKVEKAHFAVRKTFKGPGEPQKWSEIVPPSVPPPEARRPLKPAMILNPMPKQNLNMIGLQKKISYRGSPTSNLVHTNKGTCTGNMGGAEAKVVDMYVYHTILCMDATHAKRSTHAFAIVLLQRIQVLFITRTHCSSTETMFII